MINAGTGVINVSGTITMNNKLLTMTIFQIKSTLTYRLRHRLPRQITELRTSSTAHKRVVADFETTGLTSVAFEITVDGVNNVNFYANRFETFDLRIDDTRISTTTSNADLTLSNVYRSNCC